MKSLLLAAALTTSAAAGDSFFSADGSTVTFAPLHETGYLLRAEIAGGKVTKLPLPPALKDANITGLARGGQGEALFIAGPAVWVMKDDGTVKKVCDTGTMETPENLFVAVKPGTAITDWMFLSGVPKEDGGTPVFYARKPGQKAFGDVFCRRIESVNCGCFAEDGRFFFAGRGDVWEGGFQTEDEPDSRMAVLIGARIAPVALLSTDEGNSGSVWVGGLSAAGKWLYAGLTGRHEGAVVRIPIPDKTLYSEMAAEGYTLKGHLDTMRSSLDKTELIVADTGGLTAFCAAEINGQGHVFYRTEDDEGHGLFLWNGSGAPKKLGREPAE
jgi:hypothetical protein